MKTATAQGSIDYANYNEIVRRIPEYRKDFRLFAAEQLVARKKPPHARLVPLCPFLPTQELMVRSIEKQQREMGFVRHVILKQRQQGGCLDVNTRILTSKLTWVPIGEVREGDELISVDENPPGGRGAGRKMRRTTVVATRDIFAPAFRLRMANRQTLIATADHRFLSRRRGGTNACWRPVSFMRPGDSIRYITEPWADGNFEDGWFGGIIDGEACLNSRKNNGSFLTISQVKNAVYDRARRYLLSMHYDFREGLDHRTPGTTSKLGNQVVANLHIGRQNQLFRLLGQTRPSRFVERDWWEGHELPGKKSGETCSTILSIEPLGDRRMIDLQTTTKTYIAEGFVSHNSTLVLGLLYHMAGINPLTNTFTSAHDLETAETLFRIVKLYHEELHPAIRPKTRRSTVRQLLFEDEDDPSAGLRSSMTVDTAKKISFAIGRTISALHFSEVSRYELSAGKEQVRFSLSAAVNAVPLAPGTAVILESTAFVTGEYFKSMVEIARREEGPWRFVFVPWFVSADYKVAIRPGEIITPTAEERRLIRLYKLTPAQIKFRRYKIAEFRGDESLFRQDFASTVEEAFLVLGRSIFPPSQREKLKKHLRDPMRRADIFVGKGVLDMPEGPLWIWQNPDPEGEYDIAVDVAMDSEAEVDVNATSALEADDEQNFSVIQVLRRSTLEQVAEWRGRVAPIALAELAATLGYYYNTAQIAPESSGIGVATTGHLNTVLRYPNIYRWRYRDRTQNLTKYFGWDTKPTSKSYLVAFALDTVAKRHEAQPLIHSARLFAEIETFVQVAPQRYQAAAGYTDDCVMAWLIALVTSNDEDFTRFLSGEEAHKEKVEEQFFEPGKGPRRTDVDPAFLDVDADYRSPLGAGSEVDGW